MCNNTQKRNPFWQCYTDKNSLFIGKHLYYKVIRHIALDSAANSADPLQPAVKWSGFIQVG